MRIGVIAAVSCLCMVLLACGCAKQVDFNESQYDQFDTKETKVSDFSMNLYEAGLQAYQQGKWQTAVDVWNKALKAGGPDWPYQAEVRYNIALCYIALKRESWAITQMEYAVQAKPDFYDAHLNLANLYVQAERYEDAAKQFAECTRLRGDDPRLFYSLGVSYLNVYQVADAVGALSTALFLDPNFTEAKTALHNAYRIWGVDLYQNEIYGKAIEKFGMALSLDPTDGKSMYDLARCYLQLGQYEFAIQMYRRAHEVAPELAEDERNLLARYAKSTGKDAEFHIEMGDLYASRGQMKEAAGEYEKAIAVKPGDYDRYLKLARFYADILNDRENAVRWYGAFLVANPMDPRVAVVRKEIAKETAPPPDPNRKPEMVRLAAGLKYDQQVGWVPQPIAAAKKGAWVYRVIEVGNLWGKHVVVKRMIRPDGRELYVENITKEFYVDRFTFVSCDRLGMRGVWRQEWIVDGVLLGTVQIQVQ